jgi:hypothetical protein
MRYHKAVRITQPEADFIISGPTTSLNDCVVVEDEGDWYDVRAMTERELDDFVEGLQRARIAALAAGSVTPH